MIIITRQSDTIFEAMMSSIIANGHVRPEATCNLAVFTGNGNDQKTFRRVPIT